MAIEITIKGRIASGKNTIIFTRSGRHVPKKSFVEWREQVIGDIQTQTDERNISSKCEIECVYTPVDNRRRDVSGILDALFHCFERSRLVLNDSQFINVKFTTLKTDKKNAGVRIRIYVLEQNHG